MSREDGFNVLSYLTDSNENQLNLAASSYRSVSELDKVLNLERLGFKRVSNNVHAIDLFTVTGRLLLFKQSKYYSQYAEWYTKNITLEEVCQIYNSLGMEFHDLVLELTVDETDNFKLAKQKNDKN